MTSKRSSRAIAVFLIATGLLSAIFYSLIVVVATYFWTRRSEVLPLKESADTAVLQPAS